MPSSAFLLKNIYWGFILKNKAFGSSAEQTYGTSKKTLITSSEEEDHDK